MLECLLAAVKSHQGQRGVAQQVVQAHDTLMGHLGKRRQVQQALRQRQRRHGVARVLQRLGLGTQGLLLVRTALLALRLQPGVELGRVGEADGAEQLGRCAQVVLQVARQAQDTRAHRQIAANHLLQLMQALTQGIARLRFTAARPQHRSQPVTRCRAFDGKPGQHHGVARRQRPGGLPWPLQLRVVGKTQALAARGFGQRGGGHLATRIGALRLESGASHCGQAAVTKAKQRKPEKTTAERKPNADQRTQGARHAALQRLPYGPMRFVSQPALEDRYWIFLAPIHSMDT